MCNISYNNKRLFELIMRIVSFVSIFYMTFKQKPVNTHHLFTIASNVCVQVLFQEVICKGLHMRLQIFCLLHTGGLHTVCGLKNIQNTVYQNGGFTLRACFYVHVLFQEVESRGESDRLSEDAVHRLLTPADMADHMERHGGPGLIGVWLSEDQIQVCNYK